MKLILALAAFLVGNHTFAADKIFDHQLTISNAFQTLKKLEGPSSHPEFLPASVADLSILRQEKNGVIDFMYTSKSGKFKGDLYCQLSQLLVYREKYSDPKEVCFRLNIYEKDSEAVNGFGKQVGIY